jgi:putative transposase
MESFWARMQVELLNTRRWAITIELAAAMADYIDNFYNVERRHSYLGNISPAEFETLWTSTLFDPSTHITTARNSGDRSTWF